MCDLLTGVWWATSRRDGYVSVPCDASWAHDERSMFDHAIRLFEEIDRRNLMLELPATRAGLIAFEELIATGRPVNVSSVFSLWRYASVADAYRRGIERWTRRSATLSPAASLAVFSLPLIDAEADRLLERRGATSLKGSLAITVAKLAYQHYRLAFGRSASLHAAGAVTQRLAWASGSRSWDVSHNMRYIEELIGPDTVSVMSESALAAYRRHGCPHSRLARGVNQAPDLLDRLASAGVDCFAVARTLERAAEAGFITALTPTDGATEADDDLLESLEVA
jgi:transaldolase